MRMPFDRDAPFTPLSKKADRARRIRSRRIAARGYGNDSEDGVKLTVMHFQG